MPVGLFIPCFVDLFYPQVGVATVRLLEHLGVEVDYPAEQTCCGQPHFNAGRRGEARELAKRFCEIFGDFERIVCPSGSCTAMVRQHYPELIGPHPVPSRVFELSEFLVAELGVQKLGATLPGRAALHVGCHARRQLGVTAAVSQLVEGIEGLTVVETISDEWCCGFGGTFSVKFPEVSTAMAERKLEPILEADVDYLLSTDSSCLMQLGGLLSRQGRSRPQPMHVVEALATCLGPASEASEP